jgi:muconolactone delta-isomerase
MRFLIESGFVAGQGAAVRALLPQEQAHIEQLRAAGQLAAFYLSRDYARVWIVMPGVSQDEVEQRLRGFPLYAYMTTTVRPLL